MKPLFLLTVLCVSLACQAAETDTVTTAPLNPPKGRCPLPRMDKLLKAPQGDFSFVVRYVVKADGGVENVRVDGDRAPRDAKRAVRNAFNDMRCTPADTDQEYESKLRTWTTVH